MLNKIRHAIQRFLFEPYVIEEEKERLYRKAFKDAREDLEETILEKTKDEVDALADKKISDLLGFVDKNFIFTHNKQQGIVFLAGERLDKAQLLNLKQEADLILSTNLWKIFYNSIGDIARKTMFEKSQDYEDMKTGKIMLYNLSIQKEILELLKSYVPKS